MPKFTVWFRVGLDFKETIEAEDVHDAERKVASEVEGKGRQWYVGQVRDGYKTHIYDIVEEKTDVS